MTWMNRMFRMNTWYGQTVYSEQTPDMEKLWDQRRTEYGYATSTWQPGMNICMFKLKTCYE
jgi:hypothetical protein